MAFADWKKRSKLFADTQRLAECVRPITEICRAAYKAGERDGRKQTESVAEQAIKLTGNHACSLTRAKLPGGWKAVRLIDGLFWMTLEYHEFAENSARRAQRYRCASARLRYVPAPARYTAWALRAGGLVIFAILAWQKPQMHWLRADTVTNEGLAAMC